MGTLKGGTVPQTVTPAPGAMVLLDCGLRAVGILETFQPTPDCASMEVEVGLGMVSNKLPGSKGGNMRRQLTAIIEREGDWYVALCPELDIASQGNSVEQARDNLREALELFFETASAAEVKERLRKEVYVTQVEVAVG
ncbi:MAG: type II toxin-antitoxin system HicB family antitoxin [Desulfomonilaceae bacterium]|nr:type II toxin-antitoxin system HicB family antitoxin [Desulfomonilaceae bacterium]